MKKYVTPELNINLSQFEDIITLSESTWDDSNCIVYDEDNLSTY